MKISTFCFTPCTRTAWILTSAACSRTCVSTASATTKWACSNATVTRASGWVGGGRGSLFNYKGFCVGQTTLGATARTSTSARTPAPACTGTAVTRRGASPAPALTTSTSCQVSVTQLTKFYMTTYMCVQNCEAQAKARIGKGWSLKGH